MEERKAHIALVENEIQALMAQLVSKLADFSILRDKLVGLLGTVGIDHNLIRDAESALAIAAEKSRIAASGGIYITEFKELAEQRKKLVVDLNVSLDDTKEEMKSEPEYCCPVEERVMLALMTDVARILKSYSAKPNISEASCKKAFTVFFVEEKYSFRYDNNIHKTGYLWARNVVSWVESLNLGCFSWQRGACSRAR